MAEKKSEKQTVQTPKDDSLRKQKTSYTMSEVFKITDDLFTLSREKEYPTAAFVHGLIFALEFAQQSYHIPAQQLAEIKRDCRRYVDEIVRVNASKNTAEQKEK
jgi:hypothetical protein